MQQSPGSSNIKNYDPILQAPLASLLDERDWGRIRRRYRITNREVEVAKLACRGCSNEDIAELLHIKPGTVKTHLRNIYRRIRVRNKITMLLKLVNQTKMSHRSP